MKDWQKLIDSGTLDLYVLGQTNEAENAIVERMAAAHPEVCLEIEAISLALEKHALKHAIEPDPIIKPLLLATIDLSDRIKSGEKMDVAPVLNEQSKPGAYQQWLERKDMAPPNDLEDVFAKIISYTPQALTAIVWIKYMAPQEVHDNEYERFLILEGSCNIYVEQEVFSLSAGDYFQIPLHKSHYVEVTSDIPCKAILQRVAV